VSRTLRIVSYNVHACIGTDGTFSPQRVSRVLEQLAPDFVALQEVEDRDVDGKPVSAFLADRLGMHAYRGPTLVRGDSDYGNLLLAGRNAKTIVRHEIAVAGREPRGVIEADFRLGLKTLRILVTHLGLSAAERRKQVDQLLAIASSSGSDLVILAADFNEWLPAGHVHRRLARHFAAGTRAKTFPSRLPCLALDRIYVTPAPDTELGCRVERSALTRLASDHLPLVCDLDT